MLRSLPTLCALMLVMTPTVRAADAPLQDQAAAAMEKAVKFFHGSVSSHGGYLYKYSADLAKREGEGVADIDTVWVQPPGTPAVGMAYLDAWERTKAPYLLAAAKDAGMCLVNGQLRSGGWTGWIHFGDADRKKFAYRVDPAPKAGGKKAFNVSTFDDDKTQSGVRFLARLDKALDFKDPKIHECVTTALDAILKAQFPNGAWAQGWEAFPDAADHPVKPAAYPADWPRKYPGGSYWWWYTFNDNTVHDTINTLLLATEIYGDTKYRESAIRAGKFMVLAQLPDPQPAWAQQYNFNMEPAWARKFEPAAITGGESQGVIESLMKLYVETGDRAFLAPIPKALEYLKKSRLPDGQLARFYELKTNKPLYFTKTYELTYDDGDLPTHYGFKVSSKLESLQKRFDEVSKLSPEKLAAKRTKKRDSATPPLALEKAVKEVIAGQDDRGAWVTDGSLKYHKNDGTRRVIESETFIKNLATLSLYLDQRAHQKAE
ncbi:pectate lyase [Humisphaera borealis]|uniref:Pectic acid lyase n=1 Tax=Humisphaera borealis TaxID=2807512 RepID=A0A7M2X5F9_9BACT|nr:pectate lyase [Humisphaera borealis]QOV92040.1 pectic acid lyase [Humisphaera borealis]